MFPTSIAGSLPKPGWLAETHKLWPQWREQGEALREAKADATLLARLNEGLALLHRTGEFDEIYRRWFGRLDSPLVTRQDVINYGIALLAAGFVAALIAYLRLRALNRRIALQAAELARQIDGALPIRDGRGGVLADSLHSEQILFASAEDGWRVAKGFEQLPHPDWADMINHVQRDQRFPGIHA